jgi:hypothetical protein
MRLKTELRRLRVLGCEAHAKSVTLHLRSDTPSTNQANCPRGDRMPSELSQICGKAIASQN